MTLEHRCGEKQQALAGSQSLATSLAAWKLPGARIPAGGIWLFHLCHFTPCW